MSNLWSGCCQWQGQQQLAFTCQGAVQAGLLHGRWLGVCILSTQLGRGALLLHSCVAGLAQSGPLASPACRAVPSRSAWACCVTGVAGSRCCDMISAVSVVEAWDQPQPQAAAACGCCCGRAVPLGSWLL